MKKLTFTLFAVLAIAFNVIAQAPMTINYQAIVRDANNLLIADREIGMRVSILYGSEDGEAVYVETHRPTVSGFGMISIEIGSGHHVSGDWAINWPSGAFYLKTEYDIGPGNNAQLPNYTVSATSKLLAVPVALFSHTSSRLTGPVWELAGFYEGPYHDVPSGSLLDGEPGIASVYIPYSNSNDFLLTFVKDSNYKIKRNYFDSNSYTEETLGLWGFFHHTEIMPIFVGTITNENPLTFSFPDILTKRDEGDYITSKFSGTLVDGVLKLIFSGTTPDGAYTMEFNLKKKG